MATFVNSDKSSGESKAPTETAAPVGNCVFWAATPSGIFRKVGVAGAWAAKGTPAGLKTVSVAGVRGEHLVGVTDGGDAKYSADGGVTWLDLPKYEGAGLTSVSISDDASTLWGSAKNEPIGAQGVGTEWKSTKGKTQFAHVSGNGAFTVFPMKGIGFVVPAGGKLKKTGKPAGNLKQATIANDETIWGVTEDSGCCVHNGSWQKVDSGALEQIHVSSCGTHIAAMGHGKLCYRNGIAGAWTEMDLPEGCTWVSVAGVTVDPAAAAAAEAAFAALLAAKATKDSAAGAASSASAGATAATAAATTAKAAAAAAKAEWERLEAEANAAEAAAAEKAASAAASVTAASTAQVAFTAAIGTALSTAEEAFCIDEPKYAEFK